MDTKLFHTYVILAWSLIFCFAIAMIVAFVYGERKSTFVARQKRIMDFPFGDYLVCACLLTVASIMVVSLFFMAFGMYSSPEDMRFIGISGAICGGASYILFCLSFFVSAYIIPSVAKGSKTNRVSPWYIRYDYRKLPTRNIE